MKKYQYIQRLKTAINDHGDTCLLTSMLDIPTKGKRYNRLATVLLHMRAIPGLIRHPQDIVTYTILSSQARFCVFNFLFLSFYICTCYIGILNKWSRNKQTNKQTTKLTLRVSWPYVKRIKPCSPLPRQASSYASASHYVFFCFRPHHEKKKRTPLYINQCIYPFHVAVIQKPGKNSEPMKFYRFDMTMKVS